MLTKWKNFGLFEKTGHWKHAMTCQPSPEDVISTLILESLWLNLKEKFSKNLHTSYLPRVMGR